MTIKKMRGFNLIEVMIVVSIIGLIAALGYPSYQDQVRKSRRAEGMGELLELADHMERHYSDIGTYDQADGSDMTAAAIFRTTTSGGYYTLSVDAGTDNVSFTIRATPVAGKSQAEDKCHTFIYNSLGQRTVTGGSLNAEQCNWQ
jgi:type IV pilus assembly protein PilE